MAIQGYYDEAKERQIEEDLPFGSERLVPMKAGQTIRWQLAD